MKTMEGTIRTEADFLNPASCLDRAFRLRDRAALSFFHPRLQFGSMPSSAGVGTSTGGSATETPSCSGGGTATRTGSDGGATGRGFTATGCGRGCTRWGCGWGA